MIDKTPLEVGFSQKRFNKFLKSFKKALNTDSTVTYFSTTTSTDDQTSYYEVILNPLHDINGEINGISRIGVDLTENKMLEKELCKINELFLNMYNYANFGVVIGDITGHVIKCNKIFRDMLGYTEEELKNTSFLDYTHPDDVKKEIPLAKKLVEGKIKFYEIKKRFIRKDKKTIWVKVTAGFGIINNGELINSLIFVQNIND